MIYFKKQRFETLETVERERERATLYKNEIKNNPEGITLIALVVTIVVLLILAGVTISMLSGENGILRKTAKAKEITQLENEKEQIKTSSLASIIEDKNHKIKHDILQSVLIKDWGKGFATVIGPHEDGMLIRVNNTNRYYIIYNNGNIEGPIENIDTSAIGMYEETPNALDGEGIEDNPYKINCIEDLVVFSKKMGENVAYSGYVELIRDLNFKSATSYNNYETIEFGDINENGVVENLLVELTTGAGFIPISFDARFKQNKLNFNGNNHVISNLYIDRSGYVGLFGNICDANKEVIIKQLTIKGNVTSRNSSAGGLIGFCQGYSGGNVIINISNVYNFVNVKAEKGAGGLIGKTYCGPKISIDYCYNTGKIQGKTCVGGIIGIRATDSYTGFYNIKNSYNIGTLSGTTVGGLVSNMGNCRTVKISIKNSYSDNDIENATTVGGIVNSISCRDATDTDRGSFINVCNFNSLKNIEKVGGILYKYSNGNITQQYVYYPNTITSAIYSDATNTDAIAMDIDYMKTQQFMDTLNKNIEELNEEGLAKWIIGGDGNPTLDFNTVWNGENWATEQ